MAVQRPSSSPSLNSLAEAAEPSASLSVQPPSFQALPTELQIHVFTCLPIGEYFWCMLVSTQWQRLVIALPGKRHDKFKLLVGILKEAKALLQQVDDARAWFMPFLRLEASLDREQAKQTLDLNIRIFRTGINLGQKLTFFRQFIPAVFTIDPGRKSLVVNSTIFGELIWAIAEGDPAKRDAVLQREVNSANGSVDPDQLLGLAEVAKKQMGPTDLKKILDRAKDAVLALPIEKRKEPLLRAIELTLELDSDQVAFTETTAFLARETSFLQYQGLFLLKMKMLQQNRHDESRVQEIVQNEICPLVDKPSFEMTVEWMDAVARLDWKLALDHLAHFQDLKSLSLALEAIFLRAVNKDLLALQTEVEESDDRLFQFFGWLAIAKREWELGLSGAGETLKKAISIIPEGQETMLHRVSLLEAHMNNIESALTTARKIQNRELRLDALLYIAQLIANRC